MTDLEILGKNLKRYRLFKGLKQKELAKKVGLTSYTISKIEVAGQPNVGMKYLISICQELDIELCQLFMEDPESIAVKFVVSKQNAKSVDRLLDRIERKEKGGMT